MGKTIIQTIGPLYGEVVNGTVFGRPNGSVYVPAQNTVSLEIPGSRLYVISTTDTNIAICASNGSINWQDKNKMHLVAQSQDLANYLYLEIATDSDFTDIIGSQSLPAGDFNRYEVYAARNATERVTAETTYYIRASLVSGSGVPVAVSDSVEVVGVVAE